MKKLLGIILFIFFMFCQNCMAAQYKVLVVPTDLFVNADNYMIYPKSAEVISNEIINYYSKNPQMTSVMISQLRNYLNRPENSKFKKEIQKMLTEYQNSYIVNFSSIQKLAAKFKVKHVLLIGCTLDAQNYITRRTLWDFLDIPGATVLDPAYRLSTHVNLIDANNQIVLWQQTYQKLISSRENRIIPEQISQASEQLEKIKKYTIKFLAPQVVQETQLALKNLSPYQNLNAYPEIVKPQYVSIDKVKIDSKRGAIRAANYTKATSIKTGKAIARETKNFVNTQKENLEDKIANYNEKKMVEARLTTEDKIQIMQEKEKARFEKLQEKQALRFAKNKQRNEINAAKKQAKNQTKLKLEKQKAELKLQSQNQNQIEEIQNVSFIKSYKEILIKKFKKNNKKKKNSTENEIPIKTPQTQVETPVVPSKTILQQELKPVPFFRTRPLQEEKDFTINDI